MLTNSRHALVWRLGEDCAFWDSVRHDICRPTTTAATTVVSTRTQDAIYSAVEPKSAIRHDAGKLILDAATATQDFMFM